jgi:hypothetical protein
MSMARRVRRVEARREKRLIVDEQREWHAMLRNIEALPTSEQERASALVVLRELRALVGFGEDAEG